MSERSPSQPRPVTRPGVGLAVVAAIACLAQFMVVLDSSIVNVALPSMRAGLGLSTATQQWVVDGYLITFGGLLLLASRASDLFGRRRVFVSGLVVFTVASLVGGFAQDGAMLLAARFVQGAGAAALGPSSLSLITASHTEPAARARAMTWWGIAASSAGAAGIVRGGSLPAALDWRAVLWVYVLIGVGLLVAALVALRPADPHAQRSSIDLPGGLLETVAVAALVYGVSAAPDRGWGSVPVLLALIAAVVLFAAFLAVERRAAQPLIPQAVLRVHNLRVGNVLTLCMGAVITAPLFFLSLYLQQVVGDSALTAGLSLLPMLSVLGLGVLASQRLLRRMGPRPLVIGGGVVTAAGLAWLSSLPTHSAYVAHVLAPTVVVGAGMSMMMMPAIVAASTGVAPENAGIASGLINMCRQLGAAVGLAALVTVASTVTRHSGAAGAGATVDGYQVALLVLAAVSLAMAVISLLLRAERAQSSERPRSSGRLGRGRCRRRSGASMAA